MSQSKVLLYNPPSEFYAMPLGLLAVGSMLDREAFEVEIFDSRIDTHAADRILEKAPSARCVGMTVFSGPPIGEALKLARRIKSRSPDLPIIWGGWHPSILPDQCIESGVVDVAVIAQGEASFRELVESIDDRGQWLTIPGLCVATPSGPERTPSSRLVNMNNFPPVRYELLDVEKYFRHKGTRQLDYSSSRGCPYKCTFCADPMVYRSKWTGLAVDRILEELLDLHARYRMDEVFFLDDDLFASLKRIQALAEAFIFAKVPFGWKGTARADELCRLPEEVFERLRASGCRRINVGAESGSQKILDQIKKQYRVDQIVKAGERAARHGIGIAYSFITGFPGETEEDFKATLDILKAVRKISPQLEARVYFYSPYPGTELAYQLEQRGFRQPARLEDWSHFSIDRPWLRQNQQSLDRRIRNLNFFLRHGYAQNPSSPARRLLQNASRFRCERNWYGFAIERVLAESSPRHRVSVVKTIRRLVQPVLLRYWRKHTARTTATHVDGFKLRVFPTVFHPKYFGSSSILGRFLGTLNLQGVRVLDMGTGSGVVGLFAARAGARVTAVDVNPEAVRCAAENARDNRLKLETVQSDLFSNLNGERFDVIAWNPPFFPNRAGNFAEATLYAGDNYDVIERFAAQVREHLSEAGNVYLVLSLDVDVPRIERMFRDRSFSVSRAIERRWGLGETMVVVEIR